MPSWSAGTILDWELPAVWGDGVFPFYILEDQHSISSFSRYASRVIRVEDLLDERKTVDSVLEVGRKFGLQGWVLFPTRDETVAAFSRYRAELTDFFRVTTPEWETVKWAWDKKNTYDLALKLDIPVPQTWNPRTPEELSALHSRLPLAIKPAIKENFFYATKAKAWRANTIEELHYFFEKAGRQIKPEEIMVQEIIREMAAGNFRIAPSIVTGRRTAAWSQGEDDNIRGNFGRAATYVESIELPEVEELSDRFLKAINYYGLVEVEYKQDPRDGKYKLLDVNARAWGFHSPRRGGRSRLSLLIICRSDGANDRAFPGKGRCGLVAGGD